MTATPALPPAILLDVADRGELFARHLPGRAGATEVLLLHGWQATADLNFCTLYPALAGRGFLAPDLRHHGRGPHPDGPFRLEDCADDAAALLEALHVGPTTVLGYSMGGAVAQLLADRHPELVAGLVLAGSALRFAHGPLRGLSIGVGGLDGAARRLSTGRRLGHRLVDRASRTNPTLEGHRPWLVAELERGHPGGIRSAGRALVRFDGREIADRLRERGVPAAAVVTTGDHLCPQPRQQEAAAALDARVFPVDGDHDAPLAVPGPFTAAVLGALDHVASSPALA